MAKKPAPTGKNKKQRSRGSQLVTNLILTTLSVTGVGIGLAVVGLGAVFAYVVIGLLPGLVAGVADARPGRLASRTVLAFNAAGMMPHLASILSAQAHNQSAMSLLMEPKTWLLVYGFAAFGWGVIYVIPQIVRIYLDVKAGYRIKKMQAEQEELIEEWGDGVKDLGVGK